MKGELTATAEPMPDVKASSEPTPPRARKGKRRSAPSSSAGGDVRFFLSKSESNGAPSVDREFDSEAEAIVESLKTGKNYFVISEWKALADLSKKIPLIRKEVVSHRKANSI